jgi:hypothetical protein
MLDKSAAGRVVNVKRELYVRGGEYDVRQAPVSG